MTLNILFLTLLDFNSLDESNIYTDLLKEFTATNHKVFVVSPLERNNKRKTQLIDYKTYQMLKLKIGNIQKTNFIEKGISTITLESIFKRGIKQYFHNVKFDLVLFSTPPITLTGAIKYIKKRDNAKVYLLLKDIFPQNALDLGILKKTGLKGFIYKYFRRKEKQMYKLCDNIGCMSQANANYILKNNSYIDTSIIEVNPNSITLMTASKDQDSTDMIKLKYGIPKDKTIFIYGGNLGKPQGIDYLIACIRANENQTNAYFVIAGSGTEYKKLEKFFTEEKPRNAKLLGQLPKEDFENLTNCCDVGLIFLDHRFTIPNFPSRMLSYMQAGIPILAATDSNTDVGQVIEQGEFGYWCESTNISNFNQLVQKLCNPEIRKQKGANARTYLENHYTARHSYEIIIKHFEKAE